MGVLQTLIAVALGGALTIASQVVISVLRTRDERRQKREVAVAILRVHQFHFYTAQHLLKESLESGRWWSRELESFPLASDQDLREVTLLVPIPVWRAYTAAVRRLAGCTRLRESAGDRNTVSTPHLQLLLGAYVTLDHARHAMAPLSRVHADPVPLGVLALTRQEIEDAVRLHASRQAPREQWAARLAPPA
ncbi:hypothetical protein SLUN_01075 [Streptomyces lunaelactis]|uniref:Uncharacterized protein n=1 Tax=Streptomyces lunaelactis TaxID=1535768 RepID=A0A2R4SW03_9ACTN|nr:hypothetical protein [Streptomyces lunaelactis]AVZ71051.1 hypothetical protein SLUN_01075 [Streptomyces lunaelactis]NUK25448.1 hypothetical protein [Streptomyces lunaelactis]